MCMEKKKIQHVIADSIREIIFGLEDSLVSTLGAITGIAAGTQSTYIVILSGLVLIAAESTSMAAGSYLSSKAATDTNRSAHKKASKQIEHHESPVRAGAVMWFFYFIGGFVPLTPYFFLPIRQAWIPSVIATVIVLYLVGSWSATYTKRSKVKSGLEMAGVSLAAAVIGFIIGRLVSLYFGIEFVG